MREQNHISLIIGKRFTGKTTLNLNLIEKSQMPKKLIVDMVDHPSYSKFNIIRPTEKRILAWKKGTYRLISSVDDMQKNLDLISTYLSNCLVTFEDAKRFLKPRLQPEVMRLIGDSRQKNIDIVFMFHEWDMVPLDVYRYVDFITILKTKSSPETRKQYIPCYDHVLKAYNKVKAHKDMHYQLTVRTE